MMKDVTAFSPLFNGYMIFLCVLLGACMGSFLNCAAIRIVKNEPVSRGRSHCMSCGHTLGVLDLIPVFSWLFLRGKCRWCGAKISPRYLFAELAGAVCYVSVYLTWGLTLETAGYLVLVSMLMAVTFADLEGYIIPDRFILIGIGARVIYILLSGRIASCALSSLIGAVCVSVPMFLLSLVMEKILGREAMGGGDIKLFFMVGMWFDWKVDILILLVSSVLGIVFGAAGMRGEGFAESEYGEEETAGAAEGGSDASDAPVPDRGKMIPFGPAIAAAAYLGILVGEKIISWYLGLF